jgi:hypothetical protein
MTTNEELIVGSMTSELTFHRNEAVKQRKLELVRIAQTVLIENKRNVPVENRHIAASDIVEFAQELINYVGE